MKLVHCCSLWNQLGLCRSSLVTYVKCLNSRLSARLLENLNWFRVVEGENVDLPMVTAADDNQCSFSESNIFGDTLL